MKSELSQIKIPMQKYNIDELISILLPHKCNVHIDNNIYKLDINYNNKNYTILYNIKTKSFNLYKILLVKDSKYKLSNVHNIINKIEFYRLINQINMKYDLPFPFAHTTMKKRKSENTDRYISRIFYKKGSIRQNNCSLKEIIQYETNNYYWIYFPKKTNLYFHKNLYMTPITCTDVCEPEFTKLHHGLWVSLHYLEFVIPLVFNISYSEFLTLIKDESMFKRVPLNCIHL